MTRLTLAFAVLLALAAGSALAAKDGDKSSATSGTSNGQTRDWSKIDVDRDGYVSADEMEKYLQAVWSEHGKSTATQDKPAKNN